MSSSDEPPVSSRASRLPSASSICANGIDSSSQKPPLTPSAMFIFTMTAIESPTSSRTAARMRRPNSARLASEPPNSSLRLLSIGLRNDPTRQSWPQCASTASKPVSRAMPAAAPWAFTMRAMSSLVAALSKPMASALKRRLAEIDGSPVEREFATGPAWPSCAEILAPVACTASVRRCMPGSTSGRQYSWPACVRPSGATAH